jgi:hypothetical protein
METWSTCWEDISAKGIQVQKEVDSSIFKGRHAAIVVAARIYMVDTDGIGTQFFHEGGVASALRGIDQRVVLGQLIRDT